MIAEILYVKHLAKHISIENALIPIFVLDGKTGGHSILQLPSHSRYLGASFELLTLTIGPRASLLWCLDISVENALLDGTEAE